MRGRWLGCLLALAMLCGQALHAQVRVPSMFSDNMVLQRGMPVPVWGWAPPGDEVTVSFAGQQAKATAGADGKWVLRLAPMEAGGPFTLTVAGKTTLTVKNVLVGDVWVCSGQSNMEFALSAAKNAKDEIAAANFPQIRQFRVTRAPALTPQEQCTGAWAVCSPQTAGGFTAVGYFFARELHATLDVPIGIIHTSWGGTPAETWTDRATYEAAPELKPILDQHDKRMATLTKAAFAKYGPLFRDWLAAADQAQAAGQAPPPPPVMAETPWLSQNAPTELFNGQVAPLIPYAIAGAIWYQGESNAGNAARYRTLFPAMISGWRRAWGQGDFPFYFVQLANYMAQTPAPGESGWAELREAQAMTLALPKTGMAVIIDIGEAGDIHPKNKQDVGKRLALNALALHYGKPLVYSGPLYAGMAVEGDSIRLRFTHVGGGLVANGDALKGFAIAGQDNKFVWADARIDGDTVVVRSDKVPAPVAVRYAWANNPSCNLYNKEGLPASPFRTDAPGK